MKNIVYISIIVFILHGCAIGTGITRFNGEQDGHWVGGYPFQAVAVDIDLAVNGYDNHAGEFRALGIISIPIDLVVDAVLSPVDLLLWPFGVKKITDN